MIRYKSDLPAAPAARPRKAAATQGEGQHYGRRIEADGSWTVYEVSTGIPANTGASAATGLSEADATHAMMSLNAGPRAGEPAAPKPTGHTAGERLL